MSTLRISVLSILGAMVFLIGAFSYQSAHHLFAADIIATIQTGLFVPSSPVNLAVTVGDTEVDLSWSTPTQSGGVAVTDYVIEYRLSSAGVWTTYPDANSDSTTVTVSGLANDTSYDFRVYAVNPVGQGPASSMVSATPGSPAQVLIMSMSDLTIPSISANVRITNEGVGAYEYQYTWCVTNADSNLCGGGDDVMSSTAAKLIQSGESWDTILTGTVSSTGNYWFHLEVHFGSDTSYASQSFTAQSEPSNGGGGGSSSGSRASSRQCVGGDFNRDRIVNLVDFSILLSFFNFVAPFKNPCVDINQDGKVSVIDFSIMLAQWGKKPILYVKP